MNGRSDVYQTKDRCTLQNQTDLEEIVCGCIRHLWIGAVKLRHTDEMFHWSSEWKQYLDFSLLIEERVRQDKRDLYAKWHELQERRIAYRHGNTSCVTTQGQDKHVHNVKYYERSEQKVCIRGHTCGRISISLCSCPFTWLPCCALTTTLRLHPVARPWNLQQVRHRWYPNSNNMIW